MFDNDFDIDKVNADFKKTGVAYQWQQLNVLLEPEISKKIFQLVADFSYTPDMAEMLPDIIRFHVVKNFQVLNDLIKLKGLDVQYYYFKIFSSAGRPLISLSLEELSSKILLSYMNDMFIPATKLEMQKSSLPGSATVFSSEEQPAWIEKIRFAFTVQEDFFKD